MLGLTFKPWRAVALVLALATIPLGTATPALAQLVALVVPLWVCLTIEFAREPRPAEATAG